MSNTSMAKFLIGASRIKFDILEGMFKDIRIKSDIVNLYIDTDYIFYRVYRGNTLPDLYAVDNNVLVADLVVNFINVIGHYRRYISTRLNKASRIFILFNHKVPKYQESLVEGYGKQHFAQFSKDHPDYAPLNESIEKAYQFIQSVLTYIEGVYCIDNSSVENVTAIEYLRTQPETTGNYNIVFTRNELAYQMIDQSTIVLYPKRDTSYLVTRDNCYGSILRERKTTQGPLTASTIPYCLTLGGFSDRSIDTKIFHGKVAAVKKLKELWQSGELNERTSTESFCDLFSRDMPTQIDTIRATCNALTLSVTTRALTKSQLENIRMSIYDLYDHEGLVMLNEILISLNPDGEILDIGNLNMSAGNY